MTTRVEDQDKGKPLLTRPARFALHLPVRYRSVGDSRWWEGATENISRSGVLFRAENSPKPGTPVEMRLNLPTGPTTSVIACYGYVVRSVSLTLLDERPVVAATIVDFTFVRGKDPQPQP